MISRAEALSMVEEKIQNINTKRHMLATEAVMTALSEKLGQDSVLWGLTGLLHDLDLEAVDGDMHKHAKQGVEWLQGKISEAAIQAILAHNGEHLGIKRQSDLDHALAASETLTGLVVATTLVLPSKKLSDLKPKSVLKRMKEPRFAAAVNREIIQECEQIGIDLESFIGLAVCAMQQIAPSIGL